MAVSITFPNKYPLRSRQNSLSLYLNIWHGSKLTKASLQFLAQGATLVVAPKCKDSFGDTETCQIFGFFTDEKALTDGLCKVVRRRNLTTLVINGCSANQNIALTRRFKMVTFGAHAFVWIGEWKTDSGNYAIAEAGKKGVDFIEIPLLNPANFDAASHRQALAQAGIEATCSLVLPKGAHMPHEPEKALAFLTNVLDQMEHLGSTHLAGCLAYSLGTLTGKPPTRAEKDVVIETLRELAAEAKRRGISLSLEACNRYETYMYNSLEDTREAILAIGADNLTLHADTYHMNIEEEGFYKPIIKCADVLSYIHMSESHRGLLGTGTVNWDEVWRALEEIGFSGKLVLESFAAINPDLAAATCLWRPPNEGPEILSTQGLAFLKQGSAHHGL